MARQPSSVQGVLPLSGDGAAVGRANPPGLRHPPHRTGRAPFKASGSPSDGLDTMCWEHRLFRHLRRVHTALLQRNALRSAPSDCPFAMRPAFPTSDYYEGSATRPALAAGWPTPSSESRTSFPSSRRLRLHAVLGPACTPSTALCRTRHRRMQVKGSTTPLPQ